MFKNKNYGTIYISVIYFHCNHFVKPMTREKKDQKEKAKLFEQITDNAVKKAELFKISEAYLIGYHFKQQTFQKKH